MDCVIDRNATDNTQEKLMDVRSLLGESAESLLTHEPAISKDRLHLPGPDFVERVLADSNRNPQTLRNIQSLYPGSRLE